VIHAAREVELEAINHLAGEIAVPVIRRDHTDTPLPTRSVVINPNSVPINHALEFECRPNDRPILPHGRPVGTVRAQLREMRVSAVRCDPHNGPTRIRTENQGIMSSLPIRRK